MSTGEEASPTITPLLHLSLDLSSSQFLSRRAVLALSLFEFMAPKPAPDPSLLNNNTHYWWSRTLGMAQALCELQLELQNGCSTPSVVEGEATVSISQKENVENEDYIPKTPASLNSNLPPTDTDANLCFEQGDLVFFVGKIVIGFRKC
ncbi:hypothetical protein K1719_027668 [Acacia pycnantha]|nr:hypothetical protein K1719_027668 [Acacia pycnantha]